MLISHALNMAITSASWASVEANGKLGLEIHTISGGQGD